ncbi:MAG: hypothetical protein ACPGLV_06615, partial [Bacteroidia bacterium]
MTLFKFFHFTMRRAAHFIIAVLLVGLCLNANAQNVGVGTTSPQEKLHVNGHVRTDGSVIFKPTSKSAANSISITNSDGLVVVTNTTGSQSNSISMTGSPKPGQVIYILNVDDNPASFGGHAIAAGYYAQLIWYNGSWEIPNSTSSTFTFVQDTDGDTKVQVEESNDEDKIRLDIGGTERLVITNKGLVPNYNNNVVIGLAAGSSNTNGDRNVWIGEYAGEDNTSGDGNTFIGDKTGSNNTTGSWNTAIGINALFTNTIGTQNVAMGNRALHANTEGSYNTGVGRYALNKNTTGDDNTAFGHGALNDNTTGGNNAALGAGAGYNNETGTGNVFLGHDAGYNETGSNKLYIDNTSTASPLIYGEFNNNTVRINGTLEIGSEYELPT